MILPADGSQTPLPIYSDVEIMNLPDPEWLVHDMLVSRSLAALYGPSGHGKTFVALDLALSIGTGSDSFGRQSLQGPVAYVYAENAPGLKHRVAAWKKEHGFKTSDPARVHFVLVPVDLLDRRGKGLADLVGTLKATVPHVTLVIIDTLAKCFGDGDENDTHSMNLFTNRCAQIRDEFDCSVLVVHHTGHERKRERGSSAFRSNFDTMLRCAKRRDSDSLITLSCEKQKDASHFSEIKFRLEEVRVGNTTSCIVESVTHSAAVSSNLTQQQLTQLQVLHARGRAGATSTEWRTDSEPKGISGSGYKRNRRELVTGGFVTDPGEPKAGYKYALTPKGRSAIADRVQPPVDPTQPAANSGPSRVQPQSVYISEFNVGSGSGPNGSMDPSVGLGSEGGAYEAPLEPQTPTVPNNGQPKACLYCGQPYPFGCGFCERPFTGKEVQRV